MKKLIISILLIGVGTEILAQRVTKFSVGQKFPNLNFNELNYDAERKSLSMEELKGKLVILDFFSTGCVSCFMSLPKVQKLYQSYKDKVEIILIGHDLDDKLRATYEQFKDRYQLEMPVVYDKTICKEYNVFSFPFVIWIDKEGMIQAITNNLNEHYLEPFSKGQSFEFVENTRSASFKPIPFDHKKPFLIGGNGGNDNDFIQRSILSRWRPGMKVYMDFALPPKLPLEDIQILQVLGRQLSDLYRIAYLGRTFSWRVNDTVMYGNYRFRPVLELTDSTEFFADYSRGINLFCYSQILPPNNRTPEQMMKVMQNDLKNYFGYEVTIEERMSPYLKLVATPEARLELLSKGAKPYNSTTVTRMIVQNSPIADLIQSIDDKIQLVYHDLPMIDETGISENIDISFDAITTDLDDIKRALKPFGLSIERSQKLMKVLVIRDPGY